MSMDGGPCESNTMSMLAEAMQRLQQVVSRTEAMMDQVHSRLAPVLRDMEPALGPPANEAPDRPMSPVVMEIQGLSDNLEQTLSGYDRLLDRLQV